MVRCLILASALLVFLLSNIGGISAFSSIKDAMIYGIPNSGWNAPEWNWGSAVGTGHDCARICRDKYKSLQKRQVLVDNLLEGHESASLEEVKLILALTWQSGRWSGRDGGKGGYSEVLAMMAKAQRYEEGTEEECASRLLQDMQDRYVLVVSPSNKEEQLSMTNGFLDDGDMDVFTALRRCSGLVLKAVGFIEHGC